MVKRYQLLLGAFLFILLGYSFNTNPQYIWVTPVSYLIAGGLFIAEAIMLIKKK
ncbi:hypothetical protein [Bacillus coahuilensis]|uniref:hypothetical protein n=1 Tax=Bacillus coahuilensis TaxID=408580 RepID=UPI0002F1387B|nr:hypothetical protein [Bacillus coahuilensis]